MRITLPVSTYSFFDVMDVIGNHILDTIFYLF